MKLGSYEVVGGSFAPDEPRWIRTYTERSPKTRHDRARVSKKQNNMRQPSREEYKREQNIKGKPLLGYRIIKLILAFRDTTSTFFARAAFARTIFTEQAKQNKKLAIFFAGPCLQAYRLRTRLASERERMFLRCFLI